VSLSVSVGFVFLFTYLTHELKKDDAKKKAVLEKLASEIDKFIVAPVSKLEA
jgi:hypothetical protein